MTLTGKWNLIIKSPMGAMPAVLDIVADESTFKGTMSGQGRTNDIQGAVNGYQVSWSVSLTAPMPVTMQFKGVIANDLIEGEVAAGAFGTFKFSGKHE